jgi:hypothetical protein
MDQPSSHIPLLWRTSRPITPFSYVEQVAPPLGSAPLRPINLRVHSCPFRGPYLCPFAVPIRVHSRSLFVSIRGPYSRSVFLHLSYGKELPEKISEFIDRADHRKTGVKNRVLSLHRNQATHNIDHGAHFIFDTKCLEPIGSFYQGIEKINHP